MSKSYSYISRCTALAKQGGKKTKTNPLVGAVLVYKDIIIGEGYHEYFGGPHAEVNCINSVNENNKHLIPSSTLYVSLEPCCIERKTPACTNLIIKENIKHIVIGTLDPNPAVNGLGVKSLRDYGANVEVINDRACEILISKFKANLRQRPYIILKWAQSFDGYIGHKGKQIWLSNKYSKFLSHKLRTEVDGILIGKNTAMIDNPSLTAREYVGENPTRILLDTHLEVSDNSTILSDSHSTYIINAIKNDSRHNKNYIKLNDIRDMEELLSTLFKNEIYSLIIEGGKKIIDWFIHNEKWDEAYVINTNTKLLTLYDEKELIQAPVIEGIKSKQWNLDTDKVNLILNPKSI